MGGLLDMFDNPDLMSQLLGLQPQQVNPAQQMQPPAPPQGGGIGSDFAGAANQPPPPQPSPNGGYGVPGVDAMTPAVAQNAPPMPPVAPPPQDVNNPAQTPDFSNGIPLPPTDPRQANAAVPLPQPRPPMPPTTDISARTAPPVALPPINVPPSSPGTPPLPPASAMNGGPATTSAGGGLAAAFGLDPNRVRAAMSGIGKGLSAVGQQKPGTFGGASFAAGMGGALQGTAAAQEKQKTDLFNQSSTAFKDMLAAKASDDNVGYKAAQAAYLNARATSLTNGGGAGGKGALNTPEQKVAYIENEALRMRDQYRKTAEMNAKANGQPVDEAKLDKAADTYRQNLYKQFKIDPNQAEKIKTMGLEKTNPFDTKGMTLDQFHQRVPMGAWFKDQNGDVRQRTVPPPGSNTQPSGQAPQANQAGAAPNSDDQAAMQTAA